MPAGQVLYDPDDAVDMHDPDMAENFIINAHGDVAENPNSSNSRDSLPLWYMIL